MQVCYNLLSLKQLQIIAVNNMLRSIHNSPSKENNSSPIKADKQNHQAILQQLCKIVVESGKDIPSHIKTTLKPIALTPINPNQQNEATKLKVQLNDYQFDLKKMEEDFAEYRLVSKIEKEKAVRKINQELEEAKRKNREETTSWELKFAERMKQYEDQTTSFYQQTELRFQKEKQQELSQLHNTIHNFERVSMQEKKTFRENYQNQIKFIKESHNKEIQQLIQKFEKEKQEIKEKEKQQQKTIEVKYQNKLTIIQCQRKTQVKQTETVKDKFIKQRQNFNNQIYFLKKDKIYLEQTICQLEMDVKVAIKKLQDKGKVIEGMQKDHAAEIEMIHGSYQISLEKREEAVQKERISVMNSHYNSLEGFTHKIQNMDQIRFEMEQKYSELLTIMQKKFQKRVSKKEDVQKIKSIEDELSKKTQQIQRYGQQLKVSYLQLQNNEKIYKRIFTAHGSRDRRAKSKKNEAEDYHNIIMKQSNTADLRLFLKKCH